jgi:hypothetical protein
MFMGRVELLGCRQITCRIGGVTSYIAVSEEFESSLHHRMADCLPTRRPISTTPNFPVLVPTCSKIIHRIGINSLGGCIGRSYKRFQTPISNIIQPILPPNSIAFVRENSMLRALVFLASVLLMSCSSALTGKSQAWPPIKAVSWSGEIDLLGPPKVIEIPTQDPKIIYRLYCSSFGAIEKKPYFALQKQSGTRLAMANPGV